MVRPEAVQKILVIAFAGIGDTVLATPLIHELRAQFPRAQLDVLVRWPGARDLLGSNPHLSNVHFRDLVGANFSGNVAFLRGLQRQHYDAIFNTYPQSRIHYRLLARFLGARERLSHIYDNASPLDRLLMNRMLPQDYNLHVVENNLNLLQLVGLKPVLKEHDVEIYLRDDELARAEKLSGRSLMGIHVGSGKTKNLRFKRWPLENYIHLIPLLLAANLALEILLFGGPEEKTDHEQILAKIQSPRVQVAATQSLRDVAAFARKCKLFLSVDSALMHLAAFAKVPHQFVIESPAFNKTGEPYRQKYTLIRNPVVNGRNLDYYRYDGKGIKGTDEELLRCMRSVTVDMVFAEIQKTLTAA
jgi:ADP-heptose:LPS heptosyltransferase